MSIGITELALIVMTAIQSFEFYYLIKSSRRTNEILEHPGDLAVSLIKQLEEDEKFAEAFGSLIAWSGGIAVNGVKKTMNEAGIKPPKIKSIGDFLGYVMQFPSVQTQIEKKITGAVGGKAAPAAEIVNDMISM